MTIIRCLDEAEVKVASFCLYLIDLPWCFAKAYSGKLLATAIRKKRRFWRARQREAARVYQRFYKRCANFPLKHVANQGNH